MGMSTKIILLKDKNDPTYKKYLEILKAFKGSGLNLPKEIAEYFTESYIDHDNCKAEDCNPEYPLRIELKNNSESNEGKLEGFQGDYDEESDVYEIKIKDLPKGTSVIRFINSW